MSSSDAGSGTADGGVAKNVAENEFVNPKPVATWVRISVIFPGTTFWVVNIPAAILVADPSGGMKKALPVNERSISTPLAFCVSVNGEPVGVQTLPMVFEAQPARVPVPGSIFVKSTWIVPADTL